MHLRIPARRAVLHGCYCGDLRLPAPDRPTSCTGLARGILFPVMRRSLRQPMRRTPAKVMGSDDRLIELIRRRVRACCLDEIGKKPEVTVVVSRLSD